MEEQFPMKCRVVKANGDTRLTRLIMAENMPVSERIDDVQGAVLNQTNQ
jgi:hypothetical protein